MAVLPEQVEAFHQAMRRLVAVQDVATGLNDLASYTPETYSLPHEFGDLPHALLRRTAGGLPDEAWANTEFVLSRDESGWLTLEFFAWWVRDLSRSGEQIQLRAMALPPKAVEVQLGDTLKFIMDHFIVCKGAGDPLCVMQERADSLNRNIDDYAEVLGQLVRSAGMVPGNSGFGHVLANLILCLSSATSILVTCGFLPLVLKAQTRSSWPVR